jgi:hypothetical protein
VRNGQQRRKRVGQHMQIGSAEVVVAVGMRVIRMAVRTGLRANVRVPLRVAVRMPRPVAMAAVLIAVPVHVSRAVTPDKACGMVVMRMGIVHLLRGASGPAFIPRMSSQTLATLTTSPITATTTLQRKRPGASEQRLDAFPGHHNATAISTRPLVYALSTSIFQPRRRSRVCPTHRVE